MIVSIQILLIIGFGLYFYYNKNQFDTLLISLFVCKIIAAITFVFIYHNYFEGDLSQYIKLSDKWSKIGDDINLLFYNKGVDPYIIDYRPRQLLFGKLFYVIYRSSFSQIYLTAIIFVGISFVWLMESIKIVKKVVPEYRLSFLITLFLPTVLFWGSGITKELLCFPAFLYMILCSYSWIKKRGEKVGGPLLVISFLLIATLRYFYLPLFLVLVFTYLVQSYYKSMWFWLVAFSCCLLYVCFQDVLILQLQTKYINMLLYSNYHVMVAKSDIGGYITLTLQDDSFVSLFVAGIQSFKGLFFVTVKNTWTSLVSIENMLTLICGSIALLRLKKWIISKEVISIVLFIIVSAALFQLVSPNFGSLSRYRIVYWFFINWLIIQQFNFKPRYR